MRTEDEHQSSFPQPRDIPTVALTGTKDSRHCSSRCYNFFVKKDDLFTDPASLFFLPITACSIRIYMHKNVELNQAPFSSYNDG